MSTQVVNPATRFRPPSATVVSAEPFSHGSGTLRCLQKEMATYRHWSMSLWRDLDDVHIVESCPLTKLNGSLSRLHSADEDAVSWLTSYGSWHAHEKKKKKLADWRSRAIVIVAVSSRSVAGPRGPRVSQMFPAPWKTWPLWNLC